MRSGRGQVLGGVNLGFRDDMALHPPYAGEFLREFRGVASTRRLADQDRRAGRGLCGERKRHRSRGDRPDGVESTVMQPGQQ
jgi:hypothetical protein